MRNTLDRVPPHLRHHVAQQDYAAYDEMDQAVWRFVLLQAYARFSQTAHPAYVDGLARTGIGVERIPRIEEMDACLAAYGWGAVCVDGFIPPRAFQEFQALGIMTIAGAIRSSLHLAYTPAPDILHESAGHAPIIPDPVYRSYLQRFGEIGARAFARPADRRAHEAIRALSELKEARTATPQQVAAAEARVAGLADESGPPSEAALLSRLHWWTVEYGLVGRPEDYRIYGAGLLSSLGESHFCHAPEVRKLQLDASCTWQGYDITRAQPCLYVAESFEHLLAVLDEVADGMAQRRGGAAGLEAAVSSEEIATLEFASGLQVSGVVRALGDVANGLGAQVEPGFALARAGQHLVAARPGALGGSCLCLFEPPADLAGLTRLERGAVELHFGREITVRGRHEGSSRNAEGHCDWLRLRDAVVVRGDRVLWRADELVLVPGGPLAAAFAGPADPGFWPESEFPEAATPRRGEASENYAAMLALYRSAIGFWNEPDSPALVPGFEQIVDALRSVAPHDWLLRWNLLECLCKAGREVPLVERLVEELLEVEARDPREAPITMGLRYLGFAVDEVVEEGKRLE